MARRTTDKRGRTLRPKPAKQLSLLTLCLEPSEREPELLRGADASAGKPTRDSTQTDEPPACNTGVTLDSGFEF